MDKSPLIDSQNPFTATAELQQEARWIEQTKQGDQQAFHQLYLRYHRKIYALCWRMLADKESAEDVCQEIFVQVWKKISNFRGESKFYTWLHSVASNTVLSHLRKQKNWLQRVFSIEDKPVEEVAVKPNFEHSQQMAILDQHIAKLPERARCVFVLFAIEGYRHEEISGMLGMAVGSSKSQYHRAKTLLKESLTSEGIGIKGIDVGSESAEHENVEGEGASVESTNVEGTSVEGTSVENIGARGANNEI